MKTKILSLLRKRAMTDRQITTEMRVSIYYVRLALRELSVDGLINRPHGGVYTII